MRYVGIGTQRLEQEVRAKFPGVTCLRMDSDSMRKRGSHDVALEEFRRGDARILLGTQMIAKGLDFPNVTLVGVVNADTILHQPDFRAAERTFQLISQVAGRTGRGPRGGRVLVQTWAPEEPAIVLASKHDYAGFVSHEWKHRRAMLAPPFHAFTRVIVRGPNAEMVRDDAKRIAEACRRRPNRRGAACGFWGRRRLRSPGSRDTIAFTSCWPAPTATRSERSGGMSRRNFRPARRRSGPSTSTRSTFDNLCSEER